MNSDHDATRRMLLAALAGLPLVSGSVSASTQSGALQKQGSRILVAYFTRTGNTRVIAGLIHRGLNTDLFEIIPATAYPEDYLRTVAQAQQEQERGFEPPLKETVPDIASYDTICLGFPIWGTTVPTTVRSFLSQHDLSGKKLIPFITHGGYGPGDSASVLARYAPKAQLHEAFVMQADQERKTMESVNSWLKELV